MAVSVSNLQYRYRQHEPVILSIPSWQVETGQRVFLHGPSGSGKSTLLNLLAGIIPCQQGEVTIMNTALHQLSSAKRDRFRAGHIGYVFQQFNLISYLNASENVELAARVSHQPAAEQRDQAISELLDSLHIPQHVRNKPASELSIGQQQRVAVARALIKKPQLLIVDEPTSALDSYNRDLLMRLLVEQSRLSGITLVFVSHDKQLMPYFDQVVSLADINQV